MLAVIDVVRLRVMIFIFRLGLATDSCRRGAAAAAEQDIACGRRIRELFRTAMRSVGG